MKTTIENPLNWDVEEKKLKFDNVIVPNRKALVRSDNKQVLSILSNAYKLFNNNDLKELCRKIEKNADYRLKRFVELQGGKKVLAFLQHDRLQKINREAVREFLVIGNSFDGSSSLFVGYNSHMVRCKNQFTDALRILESKHLKGQLNQKIDVHQILAQFYQQRTKTIKQLTNMQRVSISEREISSLVRLILGDNNKDLEMLNPQEIKLRASINRELAYFGKNAWGLFNGITHYTSNVINKGVHSFGNVSGESQRINKIAMDFLISLN